MSSLFNIIKRSDYYLVKCLLKLVFIDNQYCPSVTSVLFDNITVIFWRKYLEKVIDDFNDKRYNFKI